MTTALALSGGADSLLSLLLLHEAGQKPLAIHARFHNPPRHNLEDSLRALCAKYAIPLHILDLRASFETQVVTPFIAAYTAGQTPNPCSLCNPRIKFGMLLTKAQDLGAHTLATGHYARITREADGPGLWRGADAVKDQSYFLALVPRARFAHCQFPLATKHKNAVLAALQARGIFPPENKESQDICFIPEEYRTFLQKRQIKSTPGNILLQDGTFLGTHEGLWRYTLGQRKGLGIAYSEPLYVIAKDSHSNTLFVAGKDQTMTTTCSTAKANFLLEPKLWPEELLVQTMYRQQAKPARVFPEAQGLRICFEAPHPLPAPGQVAAVYTTEGRLLAGALIKEASNGPT